MKCKALIDPDVSLTLRGKVRASAVVAYGTVTVDWNRLCSIGTKKQIDRWKRLRSAARVCGGDLGVTIIEGIDSCHDYEPMAIEISCVRCGSPQGRLDEEEAEKALADYLRHKEDK